jgi:hypothetical protein
MKVGDTVRRSQYGEQFVVQSINSLPGLPDRIVVATKTHMFSEGDVKWQVVPELVAPKDGYGFCALPNYDAVKLVLVCEDKRHNNGFTAWEIDHMKKAEIVAYYNHEKREYLIVKNKYGIHSVVIPANLFQEFLNNPAGHLKVEWQ